MDFLAIARRLRRWLGFALAVEVALWALAGLALSVLAPPDIAGERRAAADYAIELEARSYASPGGVIAQTEGATEVTLRHFQGRAVYEARSAKGAALYDADSGEKLSPLGEAAARAIALKDYVGEDEIEAAVLLETAPREYQGLTPVWRITFTDDQHTRLYISPDSGEVVARRNRATSAYDFFEGLHHLDFGSGFGADNALLRVLIPTALGYLLFAGVLALARLRSVQKAR